MLAYILALAVGFGSVGLYIAAFFFPEVHRKSDLIWSGVGMFYALVLWVCAGRITGGVLLGQIASVALLGWFAWQTLIMRREMVPAAQQTPIPSKEKLQETFSNFAPPGGFSGLQEQATNLFTTVKDKIQSTLAAVNLPKSEPKPVQTQQPVASQTSETSVAPPPPSTSIAVDDEPTLIEVVPLGAEFISPPSQPGGPDMPGASGKEASIEEIAPEVVLAPPAEPPGSGDPLDRLNPPPATFATDAVPMDLSGTALTPPAQVESSEDVEVPELVRPHPPDPELVEAAVEDAEAKAVPSLPPESVDEVSESLGSKTDEI
ncbi:MAG TPA: Ycf66 family protein [Oculatellaceae cyanobacterium]|jgi:hypothetical protein